VHEPVCTYMFDVLRAFDCNCDLMLLLGDVQDTCASLPVLFPHIIQAITKSTKSASCFYFIMDSKVVRNTGYCEINF